MVGMGTNYLSSLKDTRQGLSKCILSQRETLSATSLELLAELESLKTLTHQLKVKSAQQITSYVKSLDQKVKSIVAVSDLSQYLNQEKKSLRKIVEDQVSEDKKDSLHAVLRTSSLQDALQTLRIHQLSEQIRYIQTHVLVNDHLIYEVSNSGAITQSEEKSINEKLVILLDELARLHSQAKCTPPVSESPNKIALLKAQEERLQEIEENLIERERGQVNNVLRYLENTYYEVLEQLPTLEPTTCQQTVNLEEDIPIPSSSELEELLDYDAQWLIMKQNAQFQHSFRAIDTQIAQLKIQLKRIQNK